MSLLVPSGTSQRTCLHSPTYSRSTSPRPGPHIPTWCDPIHGRIVLEVGRRDSGHVGPMGSGIHHDRQYSALVVDVEGEVAAVKEAKRTVPERVYHHRGLSWIMWMSV